MTENGNTSETGVTKVGRRRKFAAWRTVKFRDWNRPLAAVSNANPRLKTTATTAPPPFPASSRAPRPAWLAPALLVVALVVAYANTLHAPFVYDDAEAISGNPTIRRLWALTDILLPQTQGGVTVAGRPVLNLSFALNHAISGEAVWSYHVFNLLVHAGSALLLFGLVRRTLARTTRAAPSTNAALALAIAALWALHPLQTQAITYTVQRAESLMGFFFLLTLYAFVRATAATEGSARRWQIVSVAACLLGMGTKEVMATAPLLVLLYDRTFVAGSFLAAWRARRGTYLALAATWLLLAALVVSTGGNRGGTVGFGVGIPLWAYPLTQFQALTRYLALSLWPSPLVFEYGTFWAQLSGDVLAYAALVLALLAATAVALWKKPVLGFAGAWFFLILAPTSLAPGTIQMIVEHRMYLPLAAVVTLAVLTLHAWLGRRALVVCGAAALGCAALTVARNHDYRSHLALWEKTVAQRPDNPRAREGLAEAYAELGRLDEAIAQRTAAVRLKPDESTYHYNLALALVEAGRLDDAIRHYEHSLRLIPTEAKAHNNLAIALVQAGRANEALPHYTAAERLKPAEPQFAYNHGVALVRLGRATEAIARYETALRLQPAHADAHFNLASALATLRRFDEAFVHYEAALRSRPADAEIRATFGGALLVSGRAPEALAQFRTVLAAHPEDPAALFGLGNALAALRRSDEAIAAYESLLRRAPDHANAHFKLGNALLDAGRVSEALTHYETAVRLAPTDAEAHHNLGITYARLDRFVEAGRAFEAALRLRPNYPDAQRHLAQVRSLLDR